MSTMPTQHRKKLIYTLYNPVEAPGTLPSDTSTISSGEQYIDLTPGTYLLWQAVVRLGDGSQSIEVPIQVRNEDAEWHHHLIQQNQAAIQLLDSWLSEPPTPDAAANWAAFEKIVDEDRLSNRKLFT